MGSFQYGQLVEQVTTTVTSGTAYPLTNNSHQIQYFTGSTAQTVTLPATTNMTVGQFFELYNASSATITMEYQDASSFPTPTIPAGTSLIVKLVTQSPPNGIWAVQPGGGVPSFSGLTQYGIAYASSTSTIVTTAEGSAGQILIGQGASAPIFSNTVASLVSDGQVKATQLVAGNTSPSPSTVFDAVIESGTAGDILTTAISGVAQAFVITNTTGNSLSYTFFGGSGTYANTPIFTIQNSGEVDCSGTLGVGGVITSGLFGGSTYSADPIAEIQNPSEANLALYSDDGTKNQRFKLFTNAAASTYGIQSDYSTSDFTFVLQSNTTNFLSISNSGVVTIPGDVVLDGTTNLPGNSTALKAPTISVVTTSTHSGNFSANGSGTYTTPTNPSPLYLKIRSIGGGGGGAGSGTGSGGGTGGNGGTTTFTLGSALITCDGGGGGIADGQAGSGGSVTVAASATVIKIVALTGGGGQSNCIVATSLNSSGGVGASSPFGGAGLGGYSNVGGSAISGTGSGGGGAGGSSVDSTQSGSGGGAGGYAEVIITSPSSSYTYIVGNSGTAGTAGTDGTVGGTGADGTIIIEEYYQ